MPITGSNLKFYYSGGVGNSTPGASLGGVRSTTVVGTSINDLFDNVTGDEAVAGTIEFRCIYFRNEDADADGLIAPVLWINTQTTAPGDDISIGLDPAGKNATATTIANETTVPTGVTFTTPTSKGAGLSLPSAPYAQNDYVALWIRRTVTAGAASAASDTASIRVEGDTV